MRAQQNTQRQDATLRQGQLPIPIPSTIHAHSPKSIYPCTHTPESTLPPQVVLPSIAPSGDYKIKITAIDQDYVPLICIEATLNL